MTIVEWTAILALVGGAVDLAMRIVVALRSAGCSVEGCPIAVEGLMPADIPREGEAVLAALARLDRKAAGLDRESVRRRLDGYRDDADEVLVRRTPESPDAGEVYGEGDGG